MLPGGHPGANFFCKMQIPFRAARASSMPARHRIVLTILILLALSALPAYAQDEQQPGRTGHAVNDEIQVYTGEIAKVGQWTLQFHNNYAINGRKEPDFEGGIIPNRALNGTPELAYGITPWWEMGLYAPYAVDRNGQFLSNAAKIRQLFVTPDASKRSFFYGVNFEFSYAMPRFSETRWNIEIRPIIGFRRGDYEFIINPIVDVGFGENGGATLAPAAKFARKFGENLALGVEYYTGLGPIQDIVPFNEQQHNIYAVVDFKIGRWDVNAGIGYGLTGGSDRVMAKMILGTDLNAGVAGKSDDAPKMMRRPSSSTSGGLPRSAASLSESLLASGF
jgi:hypothetical protein